MCIIAGYSGNKPAAPILVEMLKKTEYIDGGLSTGIATIHDGKLYMRKVLGDVDTLIKESDALTLPGTTGIIHSRTSNNYITHAHPQLSDDGLLAAVDNGTMGQTANSEFAAESNSIIAELQSRGITVKSEVDADCGYKKLKNGHGYHETELWALYIGDKVKDCPDENMATAVAAATREIITRLPADIVTANIHARLANTITVGNVTRPITVGFGDGETFIATMPLALPDYVQKRPVIHLPPTSVSQVTPSGLKILSTALDGVKVEQIDYRIAKRIRTDMENLLSVNEDEAISIYDMPFRKEWEEVWSEPRVDCKYSTPTGLLKPYASIIYECLWSFHKEGRLRWKLSTRTKPNGAEAKITKFWLEY